MNGAPCNCDHAEASQHVTGSATESRVPSPVVRYSNHASRRAKWSKQLIKQRRRFTGTCARRVAKDQIVSCIANTGQSGYSPHKIHSRDRPVIDMNNNFSIFSCWSEVIGFLLAMSTSSLRRLGRLPR